ncbi:hypothetical protein BDF14DRAFT_1381145 [Spinellus fusiger]|nr:hypothetical protein BDF14DRAFT_1381145 [Spinellus fusiger]
MTVAVEDETLVQSPDQIYPEYLTERTTMQDVVARLEEGLSVQMLMHQEQMKLMEKKTLGYKNALYTSQQIEHQRSEQLSQCQKKIEYQDERIKDFQQQIQALKQEKNPTNDFLLADQKEKKAKLEADLKEAIQLRNDVHCTCDHCAAIHNHSENPHTSSSETQELFLKQNTMDLLLSEKDQEIEELTTAAVIAHQKAERNNHLHQTIQEKNIHKIQSLEQALEKAMDSDKVYLTMDRMEEILESEYKTTVLEADLNLFKEYVVDCQENMNEMQKKMDKIQMELEEAHALKASCEKEAKEKHQHILMLEATLENAHSNTAMQLSELARKENRVVEVELLLLDVQQQQEAHIAALKEKDDRISQLETLMLNKYTRASMAHQIELNDMDRQILDLRVIITEEQSLSTAQQKKLEQTKDRIVELETQLADKTVFTKTQQDSKSTERRIAELEAELANVYPLGVPPPPAYSDKARIYEKPLPVKEFEDSKIISQLNIENKKIMRVCRFLQIKVVRKKEMIARLQERLEEEKKTARRNKHRLARADASNTLMEFSLKEASRVHEERRVAVKAHTLFIHELQKTFVKLNGTIPVELREMRQHLPLFPVGNEDDSEDLLSQKMQEDTFWSSWSSIETAHAPPPTSGSFFSFASALKVASICGYVIVVTFLGGSIVYGHLSY